MDAICKTLIIPYSSCSHLDSAIQLANFIKKLCTDLQSDYPQGSWDFMTEDEISVVKQRFERNICQFGLQMNDIEAYFTTVATHFRNNR